MGIRIFVLLLSASFCLPSLVGQRAIPDDNLSFPVLINLTNCSGGATTVKGSGFFLNTGTEIYLVTARHVLYNEAEVVPPNQPRHLQCQIAELLSYSKDPKEKQQNHLLINLDSLNRAGKVKRHPTHDVAVMQLAVVAPEENPAVPTSPSNANSQSKSQSINLTSGVQLVQSAPTGLLGADLTNVDKFDQVLTANDIYVFGYPSSIGVQQAPQIDYNAPLLRKGIIAGTNSSNKTIVLDCLTFHGNSGGPVLEVTHAGFETRFHVVGVISQYVPVTETWVNTTQSYFNMQLYNSGYSIAEPMDPVLELLGK